MKVEENNYAINIKSIKHLQKFFWFPVFSSSTSRLFSQFSFLLQKIFLTQNLGFLRILLGVCILQYLRNERNNNLPGLN